MKRLTIFILVYLITQLNMLQAAVVPVKYTKEESEKALKEYRKNDKEPMFKTNTAPDQWKNESAIFLANKTHIKFGTEYNGLPVAEIYLRTRILLNDLAALNEFSEYTFEDAGDNGAVEIRIIKKNGKELLIDMNDAVSEGIETNNEILNLFFSHKQKKIAFKNLEVGDIIDFTAFNKSNSGSYSSSVYFSGSYASVSSLRTFEVENKAFCFGYKVINGGPAFKKSSKGASTLYSVEDTMRYKYERELEGVRMLRDPYFKVFVSWARIESKSLFGAKPGVAKTKVTEEDLKAYVCEKVKEAQGSRSGYYLDFLEKYGSKLSQKDYIVKYFYMLRDKGFNKSIAFANETPSYGLTIMNQMIKHAKKRKIPFEVVLLYDRDNGDMSNLLFADELRWGIRFNTNEGELFLSTFTPFSHFGDISSDYEGTEAYAFSVGGSASSTKLRKFKVPFSSASDNQYKVKINAAFRGLTDTLDVTEESTFTGYYKGSRRYESINRYDYFQAYEQQLKDEEIVTAKSPTKYFFVQPGAYNSVTELYVQQEEERGRELFKKEQEEAVKEKMEKSRKDEHYTLVDYTAFELLNDSRKPDNQSLIWKEKMVFGNVLHPVGDNYVLDAGSLFGTMYEINRQKDRDERKYDFYFNYSRTYSVELSLELPAGYTINDLSQLKRSVDNTTGTFTSDAGLDGSTLIVTISKTYKSYKHAPAEWKEFIAFTDTAADFVNTRVLLTKKK